MATTDSRAYQMYKHNHASLHSSSIAESSRRTSFQSTESFSINSSFCLIQHPAALCSEHNFGQLMSIFPNTESVSFDGYFLIFHVASLPPRPWPRKIAGVCTYITSDPTDFGPIDALTRTMSDSKIACSLGLDAEDAPRIFVENVWSLIDWMRDNTILATEIQYWGAFIVIVLEDKKQDLSVVPCSFARCPCCNLYERDMQMPTVTSVSRVKEKRSRSADGEPRAKTWFRVNSAGLNERWIPANWHWTGQGKCGTTNGAPMTGWGLSTSPEALQNLLEGCSRK